MPQRAQSRRAAGQNRSGRTRACASQRAQILKRSNDLIVAHQEDLGLGRDGGDALLRELGARMKKQLRASDVVARLDGDEFAVLAHELPAPQQAEPIARKLLDALSEPVALPGHGEFRITRAWASPATRWMRPTNVR